MKYLFYVCVFAFAFYIGHAMVTPWATKTVQMSSMKAVDLQTAATFARTLHEWSYKWGIDEKPAVDLPCLDEVFGSKAGAEKARKDAAYVLVTPLVRYLAIQKDFADAITKESFKKAITECDKTCGCEVLQAFVKDTPKEKELDAADLKELSHKTEEKNQAKDLKCAQAFQKQFCEERELLVALKEVVEQQSNQILPKPNKK